METTAACAASQGPSGFSFASMTTAPGGKGLCSWSTAAAASRGSLTIWKAEAAAAATLHCKNVLRESLRSPLIWLMRTPLSGGMGCTATTIALNRAFPHRRSQAVPELGFALTRKQQFDGT